MGVLEQTAARQMYLETVGATVELMDVADGAVRGDTDLSDVAGGAATKRVTHWM
jgi:hypothetical protein